MGSRRAARFASLREGGNVTADSRRENAVPLVFLQRKAIM